MTGLSVTPQLAVVGLAVLVILVWLWRASIRRTRAKAEAARSGVRLFSLAGRTVAGALLISGMQWLALTHPDSTVVAKVAALVVPALFASWVLVRALTVTAVDDRSHRRERRGGGQR
ncbi:hypothetical protein [Crossiella cryophila]|uniref:Uncharacterized protein n=1 Tax=Crossiella cryophila TaxID=43355 RepID=A0A7W7FWY2_9PSEU|nr:hypothetical protein [Crossiella cryophila]MBB4680540.1 hypothetical protein [Crossiella cryophila]